MKSALVQQHDDQVLLNNLNAFRKRDPESFGRIQKYVSDADAGINFFSKLSPDVIKNQWEKSLALSNLKNPRIVVFDGIGSGHHLFRFLKEIRTATMREILVIERRAENFISALGQHDFQELFADPHVMFFVGIPEIRMGDVLQEYFTTFDRLIYTDRVEHFYYEPALVEDGAYYVRFAQAIQEKSAALAKSTSAPGEDNYRGLINILNNADDFKDAVFLRSLQAKLKNRPALLIGAGPSLAGQIDFLRENQSKILIMAVDAAVKPLLSAGIRPHLVVTAERVAAVTHLFSGLPEDFTPPLVTFPHIHPKVFGGYKGRKILMKRMATFGEWLWPDLYDMPSALGVSPLGYAALALMGCSPIYLLGQDFAVGAGNGANYIEGTSEYAANMTSDFMKGGGRCEVMGNIGSMVQSTVLWTEFKNELEVLIRRFGIPCYHVIHANEGAKIHSADRMDPELFRKTMPIWEHENPQDLLNKVFAEISSSNNPTIDLKPLIKRTAEYLHKVRHELLIWMDEMTSDYHETIDIYDGNRAWEIYGDVIKKWDAGMDRVCAVDEKMYAFFLNCFSSDAYIKNMSAREAMIPMKECIHLYLFTYLLKTQTFCRDACAWIDRILNLFEKHGLS